MYGDQALEALDFDLGIDSSYPYDEVSDPSDELYTPPIKIKKAAPRPKPVAIKRVGESFTEFKLRTT